MATASKSSLENKQLCKCDYFAIIPLFSHSVLYNTPPSDCGNIVEVNIKSEKSIALCSRCRSNRSRKSLQI